MKVQVVDRRMPRHGWFGLGLAVIFWGMNWGLEGLRAHWGFFPMWLGYCLAVDGLVFWRTGTSLLTRSKRRYLGLFVISAPVWWLFELFNARLQNWVYLGSESFSPGVYAFWSTLSFSTVIPAVFGAAELAASFAFVQRLGRGAVIQPDRRTSLAFFLVGWVMLILMLARPRWFFPFLWLSLYFILEPVNVWLGNHNLAIHTARGDWRPLVALWVGVLITAFFWEMWNYFSYPKWIYDVPWGQYGHIFEMPILGYGGYLPFALELHALYHLGMGFLGERRTDYVKTLTTVSD